MTVGKVVAGNKHAGAGDGGTAETSSEMVIN